MQFAFKKNHSTNHCSFVIKKVVSHYLHNNSGVFACALDMQNALDRVYLLKLFNKLSPSNFPPFITRFLFILYSDLSLRVLWNGAISDSFMSLNGVKQGGILSPFLFNLFIDDLSLELTSLGVGCYVGHLYFGCVVYADDIVPLPPSLVALRVMLDCCSQYAVRNNILFSPTKCLYISFQFF